MYCENCGNEIHNDSKFCDSCGHEIGKIPTSTGKEKNILRGLEICQLFLQNLQKSITQSQRKKFKQHIL